MNFFRKTDTVVGGSLEGYDREVWEIDAGILLNLYLTINKLNTCAN